MLPSPRNGPSSEDATKSMYCSPAGDSPDTRTSLDIGMAAEDFTVMTASTPALVMSSRSTLPTGTPRRVTSWLGSRPADSGSCTVTR